MGKRRGRRNNGGGGGGHKIHNNNNHQNKLKSFGSAVSDGDGHQMGLQLATTFPPGRHTTENDDENDIFANKIVQEVVSKAMAEAMLEGRELEGESFVDFFLENYMNELSSKCRKHHDGRPNANFSIGTSSDDDDDAIDIRFGKPGKPLPILSNQRRNGKKGKNNKRRFDGNLDAQVPFELLIKMVLIQCMLEEVEEARRSKRFGWKSIISILGIAFFMCYLWY